MLHRAFDAGRLAEALHDVTDAEPLPAGAPPLRHPRAQATLRTASRTQASDRGKRRHRQPAPPCTGEVPVGLVSMPRRCASFGVRVPVRPPACPRRPESAAGDPAPCHERTEIACSLSDSLIRRWRWIPWSWRRCQLQAADGCETKCRPRAIGRHTTRAGVARCPSPIPSFAAGRRSRVSRRAGRRLRAAPLRRRAAVRA